jgi:hypothetical protein
MSPNGESTGLTSAGRRENAQDGTEGGTADGELRIRRSIRTLHKNDRRPTRRRFSRRLLALPVFAPGSSPTLDNFQCDSMTTNVS